MEKNIDKTPGRRPVLKGAIAGLAGAGIIAAGIIGGIAANAASTQHVTASPVSAQVEPAGSSSLISTPTATKSIAQLTADLKAAAKLPKPQRRTALAAIRSAVLAGVYGSEAEKSLKRLDAAITSVPKDLRGDLRRLEHPKAGGQHAKSSGSSSGSSSSPTPTPSASTGA